MTTSGMPPSYGSSDTILVNPQDLSNVASLFTSVSKDTFEQQFLLDLWNQSLVGDMMLLNSLARFAAALQNFYERLSESMHCLGNEQEQVGRELEIASIAFNINDTNSANWFKQLYPGYQPPITEPPHISGPSQPTWPPIIGPELPPIFEP